MDLCLRGIADYLLAQKDASTVDPASIGAKALPHLFVIDVERDAGVRLRIRLTGTELDAVFRRSLTGCLVEDVIGRRYGDNFIKSLHRCATTGEPIWVRQVVVQMKDQAPRFFEGVAVYLEPNRIYGGLIAGEFCFPGVQASFECTVLPRTEA